MSILPNLLRSLLLTTVMSFLLPIILVGGVLVALSGVSYVPGLDIIGQTIANQILQFLIIFGNGYPLQGMLTIGFTCALVGCLFDVYNFYRYQNLRKQ